MTRSMTGYGESTVKTPRFTAVLQISTFNNRFLDIKFNHSRLLSRWENEFVSILRGGV